MTDATASSPGERETRRAREARRAQRHTRIVRRLRVLVPALGAVLVAVLVAAAVLPKLIGIPGLSGLSLSADGLVMNTPRLSGHLGEGRRYTVEASRAVQSLMDPSRLTLERLDVELEMGGGDRVTVFGAQASFDTDTEILKLSEGVTLDTTDGNSMRLSRATVHLKDGRMESDDAIEITSPRGHIRAGAAEIIGGGEIIRLSDGVSIVIQPSS